MKQKTIEEDEQDQKQEEKPINELFMKKANKGAAFQAKVVEEKLYFNSLNVFSIMIL